MTQSAHLEDIRHVSNTMALESSMAMAIVLIKLVRDFWVAIYFKSRRRLLSNVNDQKSAWQAEDKAKPFEGSAVICLAVAWKQLHLSRSSTARGFLESLDLWTVITGRHLRCRLDILSSCFEYSPYTSSCGTPPSQPRLALCGSFMFRSGNVTKLCGTLFFSHISLCLALPAL